MVKEMILSIRVMIKLASIIRH